MAIKHIGEWPSPEAAVAVQSQSSLALGIADIDTYTGGGIKTGDVWLVAGRPQMGCATFAMRIALVVANTHRVPVLYFPGHSTAANTANLLTNLHAMADAEPQACDLAKMPLYIATDWPCTLRAIEAGLVQAMAGAPAPTQATRGVVFIDSLQRLRATTELSLSALASDIKAMAQQHGVAFVLTSGIDRKVESRKDKRPQLMDIACFEKIAPWLDQVLCLYRDEIYNMGSKQTGHLEIIGHSKYIQTGPQHGPLVSEVTGWSYGAV